MIEKRLEYDNQGRVVASSERHVPIPEQWVRMRYRTWAAKQDAGAGEVLHMHLYEGEMLALDARLVSFAREMPAVIAELAREDRGLWTRTGADELVIELHHEPPAPPPASVEPEPMHEEREPPGGWRYGPRPSYNAHASHDLISGETAIALRPTLPVLRAKPAVIRPIPLRGRVTTLTVVNPTVPKRDADEVRDAWDRIKDLAPSRAPAGCTIVRATLSPTAYSRRARAQWADFLQRVADCAAGDRDFWRRSGYERLALDTAGIMNRGPAALLNGGPATFQPGARPVPESPYRRATRMGFLP